MPDLTAQAVCLCLLAALGSASERAGSAARSPASRVSAPAPVYATIAARAAPTSSSPYPAFGCHPGQAAVVFAPATAGAVAIERVGEESCRLKAETVTVPGDYVVSTGSSDAAPGRSGATSSGPASGPRLLFKAIDLRSPVRNLGGHVLFEDDLSRLDALNSLTQYAAYEVASACDRTGPRFGGPRARLPPATRPLGGGCWVATRPFAGRTFNPFRNPLHAEFANLSLPAAAPGASLALGLSAPTAEALNATGWAPPRHALPLFPPTAAPQRTSTSGSQPLAVAGVYVNLTSDTMVLSVQRTPVLGFNIGRLALPTPCAAPVRLALNVSSFEASATLACAGAAPVTLRGNHTLDWQEKDGMGETVGETVLWMRGAGLGGAVGRVRVTNALQHGYAPGVLAPITDQLGIVSWDIGNMGSWHEQQQQSQRQWQRRNGSGAQTRATPRDGVLDASQHPFNARGDGRTDATEALQAAIDFARHNYLSVYLPSGAYVVTRTLNATQLPRMAADGAARFNDTSNYCWSRFTTFAIRGQAGVSDAALSPSAPAPRPGRTTLVVPPNSPYFASAGDGPGRPVLSVRCINARGDPQPNILMSAVVQSLDVRVGAGNPAAIGVRMRGAQGSSLEDVFVAAAPDAFAGISGVSGSGGAHSNLTVTGARFGIDARETQPSGTLSNVRLFGQTCAALIHLGFEALSIAGLSIVSNASVPIVTGSTLPTLLGQCGSLPPVFPGQKVSPFVAGPLSIVDAHIVNANDHGGAGAGRAAIMASRSLYLRNVFVAGYPVAAASYNDSWAALRYALHTAASPGALVEELSVAGPPHIGRCTGRLIASSHFVDGRRSDALPAIARVVNATGAPTPPDELCARHSWGDNALYPALDALGAALHVKAGFGAAGDGVTDDTAAVQAAMDAAAKENRTVFFPRGAYRVSRTIHVASGVRVMGVARHLTTLLASPDFQGDSALPAAAPVLLVRPSAAAAPVASPAVGQLTSVLFGMSVVVPIAMTNASAWRWEAGGFNSFRQMWQTRVPVCGSWFFNQRCADRFFTPHPYNHALATIAGPAAQLQVHVFFNEDGPRNGGVASQSTLYRKLRVTGTRQPINIYQLNAEHGDSDAYSEFVNTTGVSVIGCKSEGTMAAVYWVQDSTNFSSYGHGGNAAAMTPPPGARYPEALYRVERSSGLRMANVVSQQYDCDAPWQLVFEEPAHGPNVSTGPFVFPSLYARD